jgi:hypothetical protein
VLNNLGLSKNLPRYFLYAAMAKLLWVLNNLKAPYARSVSRGYKGGGLTSFKVVLAGEKRDYWYTRGFFVRGTAAVYAGVF